MYMRVVLSHGNTGDIHVQLSGVDSAANHAFNIIVTNTQTSMRMHSYCRR